MKETHQMERNTFLETDRLEFATWTEEDRPLASALWGDPEVTKWMNNKGLLNEDEVEARHTQEMKRQQEENVQYWPMFEKETGVLVGCCGLQPHSSDENVYALGVHLTRDHWGQGYATEAAQAVIQYAFEELDAKSLVAEHHPENEACRQLLLKLGFSYVSDELVEQTGKIHPSYLLQRPSQEPK
ncbi:GNAT family N-acetyltransferase [Paenibacillus tundrae]